MRAERKSGFEKGKYQIGDTAALKFPVKQHLETVTSEMILNS
jgi:hypothetical protein